MPSFSIREAGVLSPPPPPAAADSPSAQAELFLHALSRLLGWTYFTCWIVSFLPQSIRNYQRKSVTGVSIDYLALNVVGFACYTVFNLAFLLSEHVREQYRQRHEGKDNVAQWNDAAFAIWALFFSLVQLSQVFIYKRDPSQRLSRYNTVVLIVITAYAAAGFLAVSVFKEKKLQALDYVLGLSYAKLYITLTKYIPQIKVNYTRKSTVGFSIENILLDATGGTLSLLQLILDAHLSHDWSAITGDLPKLGLSLISLGMDAILSFQHFVLYRHSNGSGASAEGAAQEEERSGEGQAPSANTERTPLLSSQA